MKFAFFSDPLSDFYLKKDSTFAMMQCAQNYGHQIYAFCWSDMYIQNGTVRAKTDKIYLNGRQTQADWYDVCEQSDMQLSEFDAVIVRKDPPFDVQYLNATYLLELAQQQGAYIVNRAQAIRSYNEKLSILRFSQWIAPTIVSANMQRLRDFHQQYKNVIVKPLDAMGGSGVFRIDHDGLNLGAILETITKQGTCAVMMQRYIPEIKQGDKRILLINGQIVPFALARLPQNGEIRANLAAGGIGIARPLSENDWKVASELAPKLAKEGLFLVGLDVIGNYLTEINVTSPTCFREITSQTGFDVAALFISELEKEVKAFQQQIRATI